MADAVDYLSNQIFKEMFFFQITNQGHHADEEEDDVEARELNNVFDIDEICGEQYGDATEGESQAELPVKKGAADDGEENAGGNDLGRSEILGMEEKTRRDKDPGKI